MHMKSIMDDDFFKCILELMTNFSGVEELKYCSDRRC